MNECYINTTRIPCKDCAVAIEEELESLKYVEMVRVDYERDIIAVYYKDDNINFDEIIETLESLGYRVKEIKK